MRATDDLDEDHPDVRPGATFVRDVAPHELAKLRLLNGSHSAPAFLGYLAGYGTVANAMATPGFASLLGGLMLEEAAPTLLPVPGLDLIDCAPSLIDRINSPALRHRTWQIAMDGSRKLPLRVLGTTRDFIAAGRPFPRDALKVAAWMGYITGRDERGQPIEICHLPASELRRRMAGPRTVEVMAETRLGSNAAFSTDVQRSPTFRNTVQSSFAVLLERGAAAAVAGAANVKYPSSLESGLATFGKTRSSPGKVMS